MQEAAWKLDVSENTKRMRKRLKRNYQFSQHIGCAKSSISNNKDTLSVDSFVIVSANGKESKKKKLEAEQKKKEEQLQQDKEMERLLKQSRKHQIVIAN